MEYFYGKTVESAIEAGLSALGINKEGANIVIIEEGVKGVLGIGGKKAKVGIECLVFVSDILSSLGSFPSILFTLFFYFFIK